MTKMCLSNGGKHRWKYTDTEHGRTRNCAGCGMSQERLPNGRWVQTGSTRWAPLMPSERDSP